MMTISVCSMIVGLSVAIINTVESFSALSSFTGRNVVVTRGITMKKFAGMTMYENAHDPSPILPEQNAWMVIASTERWISETLKSSNQLASSTSSSNNNSNNNNPYARKEVSYYCETSKETSMIVASIFRMLKEARERGEAHGVDEEERYQRVGIKEYSPKTMRETQVVVIPSCPAFSDSFPVFDKLINTMNQARRDARDYITDAMLEKIDDAIDGDENDIDKDWSVAINCAHLHPKFGDNSVSASNNNNNVDDDDDDDPNIRQYKQARQIARRSPYPTVVLEVRSTPPPDFSQAPSSSKQRNESSGKYVGNGEEKITLADIQRLEALFGKSAAITSRDETTSSSSDDDFWNSIGNAIQEVNGVMNPIKLAQQWISMNDPTLPEHVEENTAFTETSTMYVDEAYEFVFTNVAMMTQDKVDACRFYLVMPHFCSSAATSFEKFAKQVNNIIEVLPDINGTIDIVTYHPEHVNPSKRSPVPIFGLHFTKQQ